MSALKNFQKVLGAGKIACKATVPALEALKKQAISLEDERLSQEAKPEAHVERLSCSSQKHRQEAQPSLRHSFYWCAWNLLKTTPRPACRLAREKASSVSTVTLWLVTGAIKASRPAGSLFTPSAKAPPFFYHLSPFFFSAEELTPSLFFCTSLLAAVLDTALFSEQ